MDTSISSPPNEDLKDPNKIYTEEIPQGMPYETLPDIVDVGDIRAQDREKVMRRYAILSSVAYDMYNHGYSKAEENMKEHLPLHNLDPEMSDEYSIVAVKEHKNKPNDVIISYRGTANLKDVLYTWAPIASGLPSEKVLDKNLGYFQIAQDKFDAVKEKYPNANITTTGHSLGGSEAFLVGKKNNVRNYIFNAGSSPLDKLTDITNEDTDLNKTIHYYVPGDVVGGSRAIFSNEELVKVEPHKWFRDLVGSLGLTAVGGPALGISAGAVALGTDIHGLHNFLPPETFKEELEPDDILYRWISPIHYEMKAEQRKGKGNLVDFGNKQNVDRREFFDNYRRCLNPYDPRCQLKY